MEKILSRVGFMTQEDKNDLCKLFEFLIERTEKLEKDVAEMNLKFDKILSALNDSSANVLEVKNNLRVFNNSERHLIDEIGKKILQQLNSQFDEIHYLQYNLQKTQLSTEAIEKYLPKESDMLNDIQNKVEDLKRILNNVGDNQLTKEDLHVVESFMRLIAANQLIQETYFEQ